MNHTDAQRLLKALGANSITVNGEWVAASCVLAPWKHQRGKDAHPSFAIHCSANDESFYNCYACGGGDLTSLIHQLKEFGAGPPKYDLKTAMQLVVADGNRPIAFNVKEWGAREVVEYVTFPEIWLATFMPATKSPRAMRYLKSRKLTEDVVQALDLRYDSDKDAICFPIRDFEGTLCGLRGRRLEPKNDAPRYHMYGNQHNKRNTQVWYGEAWVDFDQPVVLCESVFDLASIYRVYPNVCAPLSVAFKEQRAKRMDRAAVLVTLFDADKAGDRARAKISAYLPRARVVHLYPPEGCKDPGDMSRAQLRELLRPCVGKVKEKAT